MIKRRIYIAFIILALAPVVWCQDQSPEIKYNYKSKGKFVTLEKGNGTLYDFWGGHTATLQGYRHRYYLFTDSSNVYISNSTHGTAMYSNSFDSIDNSSYWFSDDTPRFYNRRIPNYDLDKHKGLGFHWTNRAHVLFDTWDSINTDSNKTVILIVLPQPPLDTLITSTKLSKKRFSHDSLRANLRIERTGRIIFDSIFVEGLSPENISYHKNGHIHDTPYYRDDDAYADLHIHVPCHRTQDSITATVFYRYLETNGSITPHSTELKIPVNHINFPFIPVGIGIILAAALSVMLIEINKQRKASAPEREVRRIEHNRDKDKIERLRNRISLLEKQLKEAKDVIKKAETDSATITAKIREQETALEDMAQKVEAAKNREYTAEDSAEFRRRCDAVCTDIDALVIELRSTGDSELADKVLDLKKRIFIKKKQEEQQL